VLEIQLRRLLVELELNQWRAVSAKYADIMADVTSAALPSELRGLATMLGTLVGAEATGSENWELEAYRLASAGDRGHARH
ncbi:MAG: hypothetical protein ABI614_27360, partial [Planctomycetota bacterium]